MLSEVLGFLTICCDILVSIIVSYKSVGIITLQLEKGSKIATVLDDLEDKLSEILGVPTADIVNLLFLCCSSSSVG